MRPWPKVSLILFACTVLFFCIALCTLLLLPPAIANGDDADAYTAATAPASVYAFDVPLAGKVLANGAQDVLDVGSCTTGTCTPPSRSVVVARTTVGSQSARATPVRSTVRSVVTRRPLRRVLLWRPLRRLRCR